MDYELGCFGFDEVTIGGLHQLFECREDVAPVVDGGLGVVFLEEEE